MQLSFRSEALSGGLACPAWPLLSPSTGWKLVSTGYAKCNSRSGSRATKQPRK